jgi:RNA polymerase sigma-70 factor (ECF subfamily)
LDSTSPYVARAATDQEFAALVERQARLLYRVAFALLRHPQDAEDAVQETLLKLVRTHAWRRAQDESAFLARAVWRNGLSKLAARRNEQASDFEAAASTLPSPDASPEHEAQSAQRSQRIAALLDALPADLRAPLVLTAIQELTSAQVALVLDLPAGTVRSRSLRARQLLKERYVALYGETR